MLLLTMCFALVIAPALEAPLRKLLIARGICGVPVVILGGGGTGALVVRTLRKESDLGFVPVAVLDDNPNKWGGALEGVPVAGPLSAIRAFEGKAKVALVAIPHMDRARLANLINAFRSRTSSWFRTCSAFRVCGPLRAISAACWDSR